MANNPAQPAKVSRAVKRTAYLIFIGLITTVLILGLEVYFRANPSYGRAGSTFDRNLIFRLTPGLRAQKPYAWGKVGKPPFVLRFNNHGFRGPDIEEAKPLGVKRILVLGDSYTAGLDYPDDEIFTAQWEQQLNAGTEGQFEVINASCPAWGTDQQFAYWQTQGRALQPDAVIVMFSPNDLRETWNHRIVRINQQSQELEREKASLKLKEQMGWWLSSHSSFFQFIQHDLLREDYGNFLRVFRFYPVNYGKQDSTDWDMPLFLKEPFAEVDSSYQLIELMLSSIQADCKADGSELHLVKIPTKVEIDDTYTDSTQFSRTIVEERLGEFAAERSLPFYNLNSVLRQESAPEDIFMDWEFHYDKDGHDWLAKKLFEYVKLEGNE